MSDALKAGAREAYQWLEKVTDNTNILSTDIMESELLHKWELAQKKMAQVRVREKLSRMKMFVGKCNRMEEQISELCRSRVITFNANALQHFADQVVRSHHINSQQLAPVCRNSALNMETLLQLFSHALPTIIAAIHSGELRTAERVAYEKVTVEQENSNLAALLRDMNSFDAYLVRTSSESTLVHKRSSAPKTSDMIKSMIISTPPISIEAIRRNNLSTKRISLMDDNFGLRKAHSNLLLRDVKSSKRNGSINSNHSKNNSFSFLSPTPSNRAKCGPLDLLRTIEKKETFKKPLALIKTHRKINESTFSDSRIMTELSSTLLSNAGENGLSDSAENQFSLAVSPLPSIREDQLKSPELQGRRSLAKYFSAIESEALDHLSPSGRLEGANAISSPLNNPHKPAKVIAANQKQRRQF